MTYETILYETILYEVDESARVATLTLNRPDVLNAFNRTMCHEVRDAWRAGEDPLADDEAALRIRINSLKAQLAAFDSVAGAA